MAHFTLREREVLELLILGYSNLEISKALVISIHTTKAHISNIYKKCGVKNRVQAVSKVLKSNIIKKFVSQYE